MLDWYAQRTDDAVSLVMMTIPFNVAPTILKGLSKTADAMRFVILEDAPTKEVTDAEKANRGKLLFSNGAIMGKSFDKIKSQFGGAKVAPIPNSDLDKWFVEEELARPTNAGHVFFIHSKVLIIDPLSDDPLVFSGSANFSSNSLTANDENMLLIRGNTRVADIYMTEMDRLFRHFYARDVINNQAKQGSHKNPLELDTGDDWIKESFEPGRYKSNRRLLFFPAGPAKHWSDAAGLDSDPFEDEATRADAARANKSKKKNGESGGASVNRPPSNKAKKKKSASKKKKKAGTKKKTAKKKPAKKKAAAKKKTAKKKKAAKNKARR